MYLIIRKFLYDILREKHSRKFSTTKTIALAAAFHLFIGFIVGLLVMYKNKEIDHILIGEMSAFILVLLGFKNFGTKNQLVSDDTELNDQNKSTIIIDKSSDSDQEGVF